MPPRVYSERLLTVKGTTGWHIATIPDGKRAVVTSVVAVDTNNVSGHVQVEVHGMMVALVIFPASYRQLTLSLRAVAYERETIQAFTGVAGIDLTVTGYLFDDPVGYHPIQLERGEPLPAGAVAELGDRAQSLRHPGWS